VSLALTGKALEAAFAASAPFMPRQITRSVPGGRSAGSVGIRARTADIAHARFLAQPRNSFRSADVAVVGGGGIVMPGPTNDATAQQLMRARYVSERSVLANPTISAHRVLC
jgi:hypothetical protein